VKINAIHVESMVTLPKTAEVEVLKNRMGGLVLMEAEEEVEDVVAGVAAVVVTVVAGELLLME
ncbi:hypothetical protein BSL78_30340, partial [Apostichopus japonicus]